MQQGEGFLHPPVIEVELPPLHFGFHQCGQLCAKQDRSGAALELMSELLSDP